MESINNQKQTKTYFDNIYRNETIIINPYIKAYSFGSNNLGQLGSNNDNDEEISFGFKEISYLNDKNIVDIESGGSHSLALSSEGQVYAWGSNIHGELGVDENDENYNDIEIMRTPILLKNLENVKVKIISCGEIHSLALSENGDIYSWGDCSYGQLGHSFIDILPKDENNMPYLPIPQIIETIKEVKMIDIVCGKYHNISIDNNGNVFSWGNAQYGQLGIKNILNLKKNEDNCYYCPIPYKLKQLKEKNIYIMKAACGDEHSLLLSTEGKIYSFGSNKYGQLGSSFNLDFIEEPKEIKGIIENKIIRYISCGNHFSMVIDNENILYSWGLTKPLDKNDKIKNKDELGQITYENKNVEKVWCGNYCWIAIDKDGIQFGSGLNNYDNISLGETNDSILPPNFFSNLIHYNINNISFGNNFLIVSANYNDCISLRKELYYYFKESLHTDIILIYKEHKIKCHKIILISSSEYFYDKINNNTKEIMININELNVDYYIFLTVIQFMYLKINSFIYHCHNYEELINYSIVAKYLRINEIFEIIQKRISFIIYNQGSINKKFLNKINSNNINEEIKKRTLIGLDGTIYFLLNENITEVIKENSIQINDNNNNGKLGNNNGFNSESNNEFNCINTIDDQDNNELLLSSQIQPKLNCTKKLQKSNDLNYLLNDLTEEILIKKNIIISPKNNHSRKHIKYFNNKNLSDFVIIIGKYKIHVNKILLISSSLFFNDLLNQKINENKNEIILENYSPYKVFIVILFLYLYDYYSFSYDILLELLSAFSLFKFKSEYKTYIEEELKLYINNKNVCDIFSIVKKTNSEKLKKLCLFFIKENFENVSKSKEFQNLHKDNIFEIQKFYGEKIKKG